MTDYPRCRICGAALALHRDAHYDPTLCGNCDTREFEVAMSAPGMDYRRLRRLAKIATVGPWRVGFADGSGGMSITASDTTSPLRRYVIRDGVDAWSDRMGILNRADAAYIAAASPSVILALLDELEALRTGGATFLAHVRWGGDCSGGCDEALTFAALLPEPLT